AQLVLEVPQRHHRVAPREEFHGSFLGRRNRFLRTKGFNGGIYRRARLKQILPETLLREVLGSVFPMRHVHALALSQQRRMVLPDLLGREDESRGSGHTELAKRRPD